MLIIHNLQCILYLFNAKKQFRVATRRSDEQSISDKDWHCAKTYCAMGTCTHVVATSRRKLSRITWSTRCRTSKQERGIRVGLSVCCWLVMYSLLCTCMGRGIFMCGNSNSLRLFSSKYTRSPHSCHQCCVCTVALTPTWMVC